MQCWRICWARTRCSRSSTEADCKPPLRSSSSGTPSNTAAALISFASASRPRQPTTVHAVSSFQTISIPTAATAHIRAVSSVQTPVDPAPPAFPVSTPPDGWLLFSCLHASSVLEAKPALSPAWRGCRICGFRSSRAKGLAGRMVLEAGEEAGRSRMIVVAGPHARVASRRSLMDVSVGWLCAERQGVSLPRKAREPRMRGADGSSIH